MPLLQPSESVLVPYQKTLEEHLLDPKIQLRASPPGGADHMFSMSMSALGAKIVMMLRYWSMGQYNNVQKSDRLSEEELQVSRWQERPILRQQYLTNIIASYSGVFNKSLNP